MLPEAVPTSNRLAERWTLNRLQQLGCRLPALPHDGVGQGCTPRQGNYFHPNMLVDDLVTALLKPASPVIGCWSGWRR
jgi:hypothetical protein